MTFYLSRPMQMYLHKVTSKKLRKKLAFCWHLVSYWRIRSGSVSQWYGSADPDPYSNLTNPQLWPPAMQGLYFLSSSCVRDSEKKN